MMISTKGRYALRVMLDMAEHGGSEWHRLSDVAQRQQLSKKYLVTIMACELGRERRGQIGRLPPDPLPRGLPRR